MGYGCSPVAKRPRKSASTTSDGESLSSTVSRIGRADSGLADMAPMIRHGDTPRTQVSPVRRDVRRLGRPSPYAPEVTLRHRRVKARALNSGGRAEALRTYFWHEHFQ
ncbi:hypothetical protein SMICM304S_08863 [Streptomyces microflavus]